LTTSRYTHVLNEESPRKSAIEENSLRNVSWAMSIATASLPLKRRAIE